MLARGVSHRAAGVAGLATLGAILITAGGTSKASWKLLLASTGHAIPILENLLFILMAPGFIAMTMALHHAMAADKHPARNHVRPTTPFAVAVITSLGIALLLAMTYPATRSWFFWLLGITTLASTTLIVFAIAAGRRARLGVAVTAALAYNVLATLALSGLSRLPPTEASAWIQEGVNLTAQAALAFGFWRISTHMLEKHG